MIEGRETEELLEDLLGLAERAGDAIDEIYSEVEVDTEYKDDDSPLTEADLTSQRIITDHLRDWTPSVPILAEESADEIGLEERRDWERFWLVDPLDGTKEFLKRNGEFTVNIALIEEGEPVLGVVHAPDMETTWWAARGEGTFKRGPDGEESQLEVEDPGSSPIQVVVSRSHVNDATQAFVDRLEAAVDNDVEMMPVGSALKLCMVAQGEAHVYPRLAPTMEWDIGAAQCVAEEAGAFVRTVDGEPLRYNKEELLNPHFVVSAVERFLSP